MGSADMKNYVIEWLRTFAFLLAVMVAGAGWLVAAVRLVEHAPLGLFPFAAATAATAVVSLRKR